MKNHKTQLLTCLASFVAGLVVASLVLFAHKPSALNLDTTNEASVSAKAFPLESLPAAAGSQSYSDDWLPIINSNYFYQEVNYFDDPQRMKVRNTEWNSYVNEWEESTYSIASSFRILSVGLAGRSDEFYVLGETRNGDSVIEHWISQFPDGGHYVDREKFTASLGEAAAVAPVQHGIAGGSYISPAQRIQVEASRTEIFRGAELGDIISIVADPNGRTVLALSFDGRLHQFDLTTMAAPSLVADNEAVPGMKLMTSSYVKVHPTFGMCYILDATEDFEYHDEMVVLYDSQNDGLIDSVNPYSYYEFVEMHESGPEVWVDDLINYYE